MVETSVIMATYKESIDCLKQSIESIINQTYNDFEFIIILDNPDNKEHIAFINDYVCKDERIKFYINDKNMGLTNTVNRGLKLAEGKYICRMDADDISELYRMEHQKKYLEENDFDLIFLIKDEYKKANKAGLEKVINELEEASKKTSGPKEEVKAPAEEVTDGSIGGIDILEMEDAVQALWKEGIFASSGMGCTGPVVMVNSSKLDAAKKVLAKAGFMAEETPC